MIYCNPFEDERKELDKQALGEHYTNPPDSIKYDTEHSQNLIHLLDRCQSLLTFARSALKESANPDKHPQYPLYEHLVYFFLYHQLAFSVDQFIQLCITDPSKNLEWREFTELKEGYEGYFIIQNKALKTSYALPDLAAFIFQMRRAFYHTQTSLVGNSPTSIKLRARVWNSVFTHNMKRYLRCLYNRMENVFTLITGPSGSGKDIVARCIGLSRFIPFNEKTKKFQLNYSQVFYSLNLSSLSETLIESELFGHKKGAFTGALQNRAGYFESCGQFGTVFLDEIGDTNPDIQVKLLGVLQTRQFQRLGDTEPLHFQGKVMAATNRNLIKEINDGNFREDFYYRLCADQIKTPSLQSVLDSSPNELENLVGYIAETIAGQEEKDTLTDEVVSWIHKNLPNNYTWPGNFRELEQCARNIMVHGEYFPHTETGEWKSRSSSLPEQAATQQWSLNQLISTFIQQEYTRTPNLAQVADRLKVDRRTVKKYLQLN